MKKIRKSYNKDLKREVKNLFEGLMLQVDRFNENISISYLHNIQCLMKP